MKFTIGKLFHYRKVNSVTVRNIDLRAKGSDLGLRIVAATDFHAREDWCDRESLQPVVDAINEVPNVDMIALVGDFVGDDEKPIIWAAEMLGNFSAPTFATLGNHDAWTNGKFIEAELQKHDIDVLVNESRKLADGIWVSGIDTCWPFKRNKRAGALPEVALKEVPDEAQVVVLGHEPHIATLHDEVLHIAGHTHWGQARSPLFPKATARMHMPKYSAPYHEGLYEISLDEKHLNRHRNNSSMSKKRWVYTSAGTGFSTAPFRFLCPPEIVVIDA